MTDLLGKIEQMDPIDLTKLTAAEVKVCSCKIVSVLDRNTGKPCLEHLQGRIVGRMACEVDKAFKVCFNGGGFVSHQIVESVTDIPRDKLIVETTSKKWTFEYLNCEEEAITL